MIPEDVQKKILPELAAPGEDVARLAPRSRGGRGDQCHLLYFQETGPLVGVRVTITGGSEDAEVDHETCVQKWVAYIDQMARIVDTNPGQGQRIEALCQSS